MCEKRLLVRFTKKNETKDSPKDSSGLKKIISRVNNFLRTFRNYEKLQEIQLKLLIRLTKKREAKDSPKDSSGLKKTINRVNNFLRTFRNYEKLQEIQLRHLMQKRKQEKRSRNFPHNGSRFMSFSPFSLHRYTVSNI